MKPKGTELIYAARQVSSFSPASFSRRNQYIEMAGLLTLERCLDAIVPKELHMTDRQTDGPLQTEKIGPLRLTAGVLGSNISSATSCRCERG